MKTRRRGIVCASAAAAALLPTAIVLHAMAQKSAPVEYRVLATNKTSTMQKELGEAGGQGFGIVGMTVGKTALGGEEVVAIFRRAVQ